MTDKSYSIGSSMSDLALEQEIGQFVKHIRQQQNKTQAEIAKAANISRSTLSLLERGETGTLKTLIQVLRVLNQLQILLEVFEYKEQVSPMALAKLQHKTRERVRPSKKKTTKPKKKKSDW